MEKIRIKIPVDDVLEELTEDQAVRAVEVLFSANCSYEFDTRIFRTVMDRLIATVEDDKADAEVKLEIEDMVSTAVAELRKKLHGG